MGNVPGKIRHVHRHNPDACLPLGWMHDHVARRTRATHDHLACKGRGRATAGHHQRGCRAQVVPDNEGDRQRGHALVRLAILERRHGRRSHIHRHPLGIRPDRRASTRRHYVRKHVVLPLRQRAFNLHAPCPRRHVCDGRPEDHGRIEIALQRHRGTRGRHPRERRRRVGRHGVVRESPGIRGCCHRRRLLLGRDGMNDQRRTHGAPRGERQVAGSVQNAARLKHVVHANRPCPRRTLPLVLTKPRLRRPVIHLEDSRVRWCPILHQ